MPLITLPLGVGTGARVQLRVSLNRATLLTLRQARQPIPQPVIVEALIDTGAERTCIDPTVATRAALPLFAFGLIAAPGTSPPPIPSLGGATANTVHTAGLAILHPGQQSDLVIHNIIVQTMPLRAFGIEAVIGRDVLARCVLVYDGPAGSVTLAY